MNGKTQTPTSPQPKIAPIKQLVVFGQNNNESRVPAFPEISINPKNNQFAQPDHSRSNGMHQTKQKGFSVTPPNNPGKNHQFENGQRSFESPNEDDLHKFKNCNKVVSSPQTPLYKSQPNHRWAGEGKYKETSKNPFVRPSNSFTDHFYHQQQRGQSNLAMFAIYRTITSR